MSCETVCSPVPYTQGDDWVIAVMAEYANGVPLDLSTATQISVSFPVIGGGTPITKTLLNGGITLTNAVYGQFQITVGSADTATIGTGILNFFPVVTISGQQKTVRGCQITVASRS